MIRADDPRGHALWAKRLVWLVILWLLGVSELGTTVIVIKIVMRLVGFAS
jgi:hypothetical protein